MIYSWQKSQWNNIMQRKNALPHAILLRGRTGLGKDDFALHLAHTLLCQQANAEGACGVCASCVWLKEGNHPDFKLITPEDESEETAEELEEEELELEDIGSELSEDSYDYSDDDSK